MKRVPVNSVDEGTRARLKHQTLLQEFLQLQKEFVSKKKKLLAVNQRRETLLAKFLRQRYSYLSTIKSRQPELEQDSVQSQNPYLQSKTVKPKNFSINEAGERRPSSLPGIGPYVVHEEKGGRNRVDVQALLRNEKSKNCSINGKRVGKKKISWQDPVALKV